MEVKKKHHYVMQNYLSRWKGKGTSKKEGVWVKNISQKSTYFCTDLNSIAQINYFYELHLDQDTFGLLLYRYEKYEQCKSSLQLLSTLVEIDEYKKKKLLNHEKMNVFNTNILEDSYSRLERNLAKILQSIDKNLSGYINKLIFNEANLSDLILLFIVQLFRTRAMKELLDKEMRSIYVNYGDGAKGLLLKQKDNYLKASLYLDSIVTSSKFCSEKYSIEILINNNSTLLVTADAPAIVISKQKDWELSKFVGYMPLTPRIGMIVRGHQPLNKSLIVRVIDQREVLKLNKLTKNSFCKQVYSKVKLK
ncbi:MAG: DUF4238 domain-containing protein [Moritella sp.]|uniref:DUF4238 domain-containing protein n=1 Tax=Moritella sp. TaxID=78556 RepID=UPI001E12D9C0|nr:DUF4238 domain-containing protein [Moritella sp.]NQZ49512.1 DUF4238 domain-containing protein [Moritella sp.]